MVEKNFWEEKKVFITGHTGFKGAWLCEWLLMMGAKVTGYALMPPTNPNLFELAQIKENKNLKSIIGDVRDSETLSAALQESSPNVVFHMAAQPIVRDSYMNPVNTYETNVMGTVNLLEAVRKYYEKEKRLNGNCLIKSVVNVTTDKVYENKEWCWGYRENENLCGHDPYSNSKSCSELVTFSYKKSFFSCQDSPAISTARSGNVIGGGDFAKDRIIPDCIRAAEKGEPILVRNPFSIRPYQHVLDCLSGYLVLAQKQFENKDKFEGSYNFGPEDNNYIDTGALVEIFCELWSQKRCSGYKQKWHSIDQSGPHEANILRLDSSKSKSVLNWRSRLTYMEALEKTVEIAQKHNKHDELIRAMRAQIEGYIK